MKHLTRVLIIGIVIDFLLLIREDGHNTFFQEILIFISTGVPEVLAEAFGGLLALSVVGGILYLPLYFLIFREPKKDELNNTNEPSLAKAVINHSKELVQEVKPTINNYIQKHNKIDEIVIKDNLKVEDINEDEIYEQVLHEIEKDDKVKSTWAKALSQSDGDDKKAQSLYIKLRVDFLIEEKKKIIENEKREYEELEKKRVEHERLEQEKSKFNNAKEEYLKDYEKRRLIKSD